MPLANVAAVAPQRNTLEGTIIGLDMALNHFETTYYSGATPIVPTPPELTRLIAEGVRLMGVLRALGTAHDHATIQTFANDIETFRDDIDNAQPLFAGHEAEWRTNVMNLAQRMEAQSTNYISHASGSWIRRVTRRGLDTVGLNEHTRTATKRFLGRHKGKIVGVGAAGAVLWGALSMDGCKSSSPAGPLPPAGNTSGTPTKHIPIDKQGNTTSKGTQYDNAGKKFSVGGFLNASKTIFPNGSSPSSQAFQGVWNYIAANCSDEKIGLGEQYHFHTTPDTTPGNLSTTTHYDISAYTADHDAKVIEITWQKEHGANGIVTTNGNAVDERTDHTWRYTMNTNGTIDFTDIYTDGRIVPRGIVNKTQFQSNLKEIQGF